MSQIHDYYNKHSCAQNHVGFNVRAHICTFVPLHRLHADWDRDPPSLPFKSHKTINLTSTDHPILLGSTDALTANSSLDFTSRASAETLLPKEVAANPVVVSDPDSLRLTQV